MSKSRKILFISNDASRTGAPLFLLHLLKWLRVNTSFNFEILLGEDNALTADFQGLAKTRIWDAARASEIKSELFSANLDLIYANRVANAEILEQLRPLGLPTLCHVHALDHNIFRLYGQRGPKAFDYLVDRYIAVSKAVANNLTKNYLLPQDKIAQIYGFAVNTATNMAVVERNSCHIRQSLGILPDAVVVLCVGSLDWIKGADLFNQLAIEINRRCAPEPIHFVWVGDKRDEVYVARLRHDLRKAGFEDRVHLTDSVVSPQAYFAAGDIFVLPSREDAFPMVMLEAASFGKPIVCFQRSGGASEFVQKDCGFAVPYLDLQTMAEKIELLIQSPDLRAKFGVCGQKKVRSHHTIDVIGPQIVSEIVLLLRRTAGVVYAEVST